MLKNKFNAHGFSLIEMIIVVAFLTILMAIAIPNYLNFQKKAKAAEARANLGAIRRSMTAYYSENDNFGIGNVGTLVFGSGDNQGTPFGASSTARGDPNPWISDTRFSVLGFNAEGGVYFNYSLSTNNLSGDQASFTAMASADLDRNGNISHYYMSNSSLALSHVGDRF